MSVNFLNGAENCVCLSFYLKVIIIALKLLSSVIKPGIDFPFFNLAQRRSFLCLFFVFFFRKTYHSTSIKTFASQLYSIMQDGQDYKTIWLITTLHLSLPKKKQTGYSFLKRRKTLKKQLLAVSFCGPLKIERVSGQEELFLLRLITFLGN